MTVNVFSRPEGWFTKPAEALLDFLWNATLVMTFAFGAILALSLAVSLAADANLVKIPDRICASASPTDQGKLICN